MVFAEHRTCQTVELDFTRKTNKNRPDPIPQYEAGDHKPSKPIGPASVAGPFFYGAIVRYSSHCVAMASFINA